MNIVRKQVAFNLDDPHQKALLEYIEATTKNFSAYGKTLIHMDMLRETGAISQVAVTSPTVPTYQEPEPQFDDVISEADRKAMSDLLG